MNIHLPEDLERFVQAEIMKGHFASEQEAITLAVQLLRQQGTVEKQQMPLSEDESEHRLLQAGTLGNIPPARLLRMGGRRSSRSRFKESRFPRP